jgi:hypothetical protein
LLTLGDDVQWVPLGARADTVRGCTGLCSTDRWLYCAWNGPEGANYLTILDKSTYDVLDVGRVENVRDIHSITIADNWLYLVSSGTDEVSRIPANRAGGLAEVVWRTSDAGRDTHHVNSILATDGRLLCSAFGPKAGERWSTAVNGYVVDIGSNAIVWNGIEHPHSLASRNGELYVIESRRTRLLGMTHGELLTADGYARGLMLSDDGRGVIGLSRGRTVSRSLGTIENPADPGELAGRMGLLHFTISSDGSPFVVGHEVDLSPYGVEIYDILEIPS